MSDQVAPFKAFFRDLSSAENLENGREYHAAGFVLSKSEDRVEVLYVHPFSGLIVRTWRTTDDVQMYPVEEGTYEEYEYRSQLENLLHAS